MATSVTFNGITRFIPGGITKINAEALGQAVSGINSIVALVGESDGGPPGSATGLIAFDDPSSLLAAYKAGPLVDAGRFAFQSSDDPDIPGGASRIWVYKTNAATQSSVSLAAEATTRIVEDVVGSGPTATTFYSTALRAFPQDYLVGYQILTDQTSAPAGLVLRTITANNEGTITFASSTAPNASDPYILFGKDSVFLGLTTAGSTTTTINLPATPLVANAHAGQWVYIHRDTPSASTLPTYLRKIVSNTTSSITVSEALPDALPTGKWIEIVPYTLDVTSADYGSHTNNILVDVDDGVSEEKILTVKNGPDSVTSPAITNQPVLQVFFEGSALDQTRAVLDTLPSTSTLVKFKIAGSLTLTEHVHVGAQVKVETSAGSGVYEYTTIQTNSTTEFTVFPALSFVPEANADIQIFHATGSSMEVVGASGVPTSFRTDVGYEPGHTGISITFDESIVTVSDLAARINQESAYTAVVPAGVNGDTTLVADLDFGPATRTIIQDSFSLAEKGLTKQAADVAAFLTRDSQFTLASRSTTSTYSGARPPAALVDFLPLTGGTRGVSTNTDFQNALDALLLERVTSVVPLVDQDLSTEGLGSTATVASVIGQLSDHVLKARKDFNSERGGYIGFRGTKSAIIAQAQSINDQDIQLCAQNPTFANSVGTPTEYGPRMLAVAAASMRSGAASVGEPLTFKFIRTQGLTQDSSWDPSNKTDATALIQAGVLFGQTISGKGTRWVRDLTTYSRDNNLAFTEGSIRDIVRYVSYNVREAVVDEFTGKKSTPRTIGNIRTLVSGILERFRNESIIVDSTDPISGATVLAYHNLTVTASGDTVTMKVGIFPAPGINFILNEIFLQLPTQSA